MLEKDWIDKNASEISNQGSRDAGYFKHTTEIISQSMLQMLELLFLSWVSLHF